MAYSVAQNTSFLTLASVLQKAVSFFYFILVARVVGVENTGQYFFAIAFTTIFTVVADFGLAPVLTRESSKYPDNLDKYVNTVFISKVLFGILTYILVVVLVNVLKYPVVLRELIYLSGVTMFFDNLHTVFYSAFRAKKNLVYEAVGMVGSQLITMIIGTVAIVNRSPLIWLIGAYTVASFINFIYSAYFAKLKLKISYNLKFDRGVFKSFLLIGIPFAVAGIVGRLYSYSDSLIMSKLLTSKELGWWSVPYKIAFAFQFIPIALSASVYPVFSSLYLSAKSEIAPLFEKSWRYLFVIIFPLSIGLIASARPAIYFVYGQQYELSIVPLRILMVSLIFGYLGFITGALLNAINKQKLQTITMALALVVNVALNIFLIPKFRLVGAAISALVGNMILVSLGYYFGSRSIPLYLKSTFYFGLKTFICAGIMGVGVYALAGSVHFLLLIPLGAVIYFLLLIVFKILSVSSIVAIYHKVLPHKYENISNNP